MITFRKYFLLAGFLFILLEAKPQPVQFFNTRLGIDMQAQRDEGMSPLSFRGPGIYFGAEYQRTIHRRTDWIEVNHTRSKLINTKNNPLSELASSIKTFTFYHADGANSKMLHYGWSNINALTLRNNSSFDNFSERSDYYTSFGPAIRLHYPFSLFNLNFSANAITHMQLIGFFMRPSIATNAPKGFIVHNNSFWNAFTESAELFYPGKAWNLGFRPKLSYHMQSGNKLTVCYDFDYLKLNSITTLTRASGTWKLTLSARLSKL